MTEGRATARSGWRSRIVGESEVPPSELVANPLNWRTHPKRQVDALGGLLGEVGWVQRVIVNRTTGHVVDGHARVALATARGEAVVPVVYVELTPEEERLVLASLDPIGAMAHSDPHVLDALMRDVTTSNAALQELLSDVGLQGGIASVNGHGADDDASEDDIAQALWPFIRVQVSPEVMNRWTHAFAQLSGDEDRKVGEILERAGW